MMGLHPTYVKENYLEELAHVEKELASKKFMLLVKLESTCFWDKTFLKVAINNYFGIKFN